MSLDGGLDELLEFFSNLANRASNSVILASSTAQLEHRDVVARSSIATPNYPNHLTPTKITLETVNGYTQGSRSPAGRRWLERIWTAIATCTQHGKSVFDFLDQSVRALFADQPAPALLFGTS